MVEKVMIENCPACGAPNDSQGSFCESCGADTEAPLPTQAPACGHWEAVITCDRKYFDRVEADGLEFPSQVYQRIVAMDRDCLTIGRGPTGVSGETIDVDLSVPPVDAGISHRHAQLSRRPDGVWTITDCSSTNGTYLNDSASPIDPGVPVTIAEGDRIHLGAWTTIAIRESRLDGVGQS